MYNHTKVATPTVKIDHISIKYRVTGLFSSLKVLVQITIRENYNGLINTHHFE